MYEVRCWTLDELEASRDVSYPTRLEHFLRELLQNGPPTEPIDVAV